MKDFKENLKAIENVFSVAVPSIGIDIDGCVDEAPIFFQILTNRWPGKIFVITCRDNREKAVQDLQKYKIQYTDLVLVNSLEAKAKIIQENGIYVFFDDQPEALKEIVPGCNVMLVRNEGNFNFEVKKWVFSDKTGIILRHV